MWRGIDGISVQLELARIKGSEADGITSRAYAQTKRLDGVLILEKTFNDSVKVPQYFIKELARRQR